MKARKPLHKRGTDKKPRGKVLEVLSAEERTRVEGLSTPTITSTYSTRPADIRRRWTVIDVNGKDLDLARQIASIVKGNRRHHR